MHIIIWHLEKYCRPSLKVHMFWLRHVQLCLQWVPVCLNTIVLSVRKYTFSSYSQPVMHPLQQCAKSSTSRGHWGSKHKVDTGPLLFDTVLRQYEARWTPCLLELHSWQFIVEHCPVSCNKLKWGVERFRRIGPSVTSWPPALWLSFRWCCVCLWQSNSRVNHILVITTMLHC